MAKTKINRQAGQEHENDLYGQSLIHNKKLRGSDESFTDAMRQGEVALGEKCSVVISEMLKKACRS